MIIALDIGLKRIGVAALVNGVALPMEPFLRKNRNEVASRISAFLETKGAEVLVIGLPEDEVAQNRVRHFVGLLKFSGEIKFVDESFTSVEGLESMRHQKRKSRERNQKNGVLDSLSALKILERYVDSKL